MSYHELGFTTTNVTINNAAFEILGSTVIRARIMEMGLTMGAAGNSTFGLGYPAAQGVTPGSLGTVDQDDPADPAPATRVARSWATSPTAPAVYKRLFSWTSFGQGGIFVFPKGLVLSTSGAKNSLVLFNVTATVAINGYIVVEE
jgi:hypothetical protein